MSLRKIKVLHIISHLELGGAQKVALSLIKGLNSQFFEVYFISSPSGTLLHTLGDMAGINIELIPSLKRGFNPVDDLVALIKLYRYIKRNKFDVVHTHCPKAGILGRWAAKLAGVPAVVHTVHGYPFYPGQNLILKNVYIFLESITSRITHKLIAVCESDIKKGFLAGIGCREKYILIREGIEVNKDELSKHIITKNELGFPESSFLIGMVSCLKAQKSPLDFVKAAALIKEEIPGVYFVLVGDGPLRRKVEQLRRRLGLKDNFLVLGWREDVMDIIPLFDAVVLTSLWEGLPISLLEAVYFGKPIVATNVDGIKELIRDGENGFLVEPGNYRLLSRRVIQLLENKSLCDSFVLRSRNEVLPRFDLASTIGQTERLYFELMEGVKNDN
jgi:glycosyltransferase involved in cell wall biosynthesis